MKKEYTQIQEIKLVGITIRTSTALEFNQATAQIGKTMQRFFEEKLQEKMINRKNPGKIFAVYTNYESDLNGAYDYFIGEEVSSFEAVDSELNKLVIPMQKYSRFTSNPGKMPDVVINLWQEIWKMDEKDLGGNRGYIADFEVYDTKNMDPENSVADIYVGIIS